MDSVQRAMHILSLMRLEDGRTWGETSAQFQRDNAAAILDPSPPLQTWIELPRGGRKTTDVAAIVLAALREQAPPMARAYIGASDGDQAAELVDAGRGLVGRTPELDGEFTCHELTITCTRTGASVTALPADASAMGKRGWMIILDEVGNWPETKGARRFWGVLTSGNRKIAECRTVVITNAGDPAHWAWKRRETARLSEHWRFFTVPGPLPWLSAEDLEILRENAEVPSEYARLHLNIWSTSEDRLATREDLAACTVLDGPQLPRPGVQYAIAADLGSTNDASVVAVLHAWDGPAGRTATLDHIERWRGSKAAPVDLAAVRDAIGELSRSYGAAPVTLDPWQGLLLAGELREQGVTVSEFTFSGTSVGRLAVSLHQAIRQHRLEIPPDQDLLDELATVRLRKNTLGTYRLDHDSGAHDDQAVCIALGVHALLDAVPAPRFLFAETGPLRAGDINGFGLQVMADAGRWGFRPHPDDHLWQPSETAGATQPSPFT